VNRALAQVNQALVHSLGRPDRSWDLDVHSQDPVGPVPERGWDDHFGKRSGRYRVADLQLYVLDRGHATPFIVYYFYLLAQFQAFESQALPPMWAPPPTKSSFPLYLLPCEPVRESPLN